MNATPDPRLKAEEVTVLPLAAFDERVSVLGSKSYTNRYLAIASLSGRETVIKGALLSDDTLYFARAIETFGHVTDQSRVAADEPPDGVPEPIAEGQGAVLVQHGDDDELVTAPTGDHIFQPGGGP